MEHKKKIGILLHVTSLPECDSGVLGDNAYKFVDILAEASVDYWQVLPLGITGYGDSPYSSVSAYAGNPKFIRKRDTNIADEDRKKEIIASDEYQEFIKNNEKWLFEYAMYMYLKEKFGKTWHKWPKYYRYYQKKKFHNLRGDIEKWYIEQYLFYRDWWELKEYAHQKGVSIIGDMPYYVATDSADTWANRQLFRHNKRCRPIYVGGCPPDYFSKTGQLWGNVVYDWQNIRKQNYRWWIERINNAFELYDVLRLDHFRGFEGYWQVSGYDKTAERGKWMRGPGMELFGRLKKKYPNESLELRAENLELSIQSLDNNEEKAIIAEDLGVITDRVRKLLVDTGYPGMKVLEFAFDGNNDNPYLPYRYPCNAVAYTGTHDNETLIGWYRGLDDHRRNYVDSYLRDVMKVDEKLPINLQCIEALIKSNADTVIIPLQDVLGLGNEARMNLPSTVGNGNWQWKLDGFDEKLIENMKKIKEIREKYKTCIMEE